MAKLAHVSPLADLSSTVWSNTRYSEEEEKVKFGLWTRKQVSVRAHRAVLQTELLELCYPGSHGYTDTITLPISGSRMGSTIPLLGNTAGNLA